MRKILAFAGSNSNNSINKQLVTYTTSLFNDVEIEILDLNDYELPIFSIDKETETGIPQLAHDFYTKIGTADVLVLSLAEHNGAYSSAFKNIFDWTSRINGKNFQGKKMLLMATSPGARGGSSVLEMAKDRFPRHDADVVGVFSLPSFHDNFDIEKGITDLDLKKQLFELVAKI